MKFNYLFFAFTLVACAHVEPVQVSADFDTQGNRGARGLYPENGIDGFKAAVKMGVKTLDMDLVITRDGHVVVSHHPWMSAEICATYKGDKIHKDYEKEYNIFNMDNSQVEYYDCGRMGHPLFPNQKKISSKIPMFQDVVLAADSVATALGRPMPNFNVEIRRVVGQYAVFHPTYDFYAQAVMHELRSLGIESRTTVQSFDARTLVYLHQTYPRQDIGLLVDNDAGVVENLKQFYFKPDVYSPNFNSLTDQEIKILKAQHIKIIPWTVNDPSDMRKLIRRGVDGLITDYPDRLLELIEQ